MSRTVATEISQPMAIGKHWNGTAVRSEGLLEEAVDRCLTKVAAKFGFTVDFDVESVAVAPLVIHDGVEAKTHMVVTVVARERSTW